MNVVIVTAVLAAVLCWPRRRVPRDRLSVVAARHAAEVRPAPPLRRPVVIAAACAVVAVVLAGGSWWWAAALAVCGIVGARAQARPVVAAESAALAADLMAACMASGAGVADALGAAAAAVDGPLRDLAEPVVDELRRGSPPEQAWAGWLADERLAPVARSCVRSSGSGAAVAAELGRVASRIRAHQRALVQERVARASVWVVLPLGLCFLPAFVLLGVVPLVVGLLQSLR